ncbi:MAG: hypothetical protein NVS9B4_02350 [Candidatus Acidiferrum sp.]
MPIRFSVELVFPWFALGHLGKQAGPTVWADSIEYYECISSLPFPEGTADLIHLNLGTADLTSCVAWVG